MNRRIALVLALSVSGVLPPASVRAGASGPDVSGYRWTNSLPPEPTTTFGWLDLSRTGIDSGLRGDDAAFGPTPLGFSFPFYGRNVTEVAFSTNGLVTFGGADVRSSNAPIPSPELPNQLVAVLFDDLTVPSDGAVLFQAFRAGEIAPADKGAAFVVEWLNVAFAAADGRATFEVVLFADGDIKVQYLSITGPFDSATVGIEDAAGRVGLEYQFDGVGDPIGDGVAVVFSPPPGPNEPPAIDSFTATPSTGTAPLTVVFEVAATDPDGAIAEVRWDFDGDGTVDQSGTAFSASFTYERHGTFTAVATVVDDAEATASASTTVTVSSSVTFSLAIEVVGQGTVTSSPPGIDCGAVCAAEFSEATVVRLLPSPARGSAFTGWTGDGDCADGSVLMDGPKTCTATFDTATFPLSVALLGEGQGRVTSSPSGIDCGERCSAEFPFGTVVTLAAQAVPPGSVFAGWSGDADCLDGTVTMDSRKGCTATFELVLVWTLTVEPGGPGHGSVRSIPSGIDCGLDCVEDYAEGTVVRLVPQADPGSVFLEWTGHDPDCDDGTVVMDLFKTCVAFFDVMPGLSVAASGPGRGIITSNPPGIDCGADCSEHYLRDTVVTLSVHPAEDSFFVRWQGDDIDCLDGTVTMNAAKACTAVFDLRPVNFTLELAGSGFGSVVMTWESDGGRCSKSPQRTDACSVDFPNGTVVRLEINPIRGSVFAGWSGDPDCSDGTVTLDAPKVCTATFDMRSAALFVQLLVDLQAGGHGTVTVTPGGLTCAAEQFVCATEFEPGSIVTVSANPAPGSVFAGFDDDCSGLAPTCTLRVDTISTVEARFKFLRVESVAVAPPGPAVTVGEQVRFTATASLHDSSAVPLEGELALWSSSDPTVATVAPDGSATARSPGLATITARTAIHRPIAITAGGGPRTSPAPRFADEILAHTCALLSDGSIDCWGDNSLGQLGTPRPHDGSSFGPVRVSGIASAKDVTAGAYHTCAVLSDGTVRCWGANHVGQLGTGNVDEGSGLPVPVEGLATAVSVDAALFHTCALLEDGGVRCWGNNAARQLGELGGTGSSVPVPVPGVADGRGLALGLFHTCVALTDGRVLCWGLNHVGQLGNGTLTTSAKPTLVDGITTAVAVTAGDYHTCALLEEGTIRCWGANGGLGHGGLVSPVAPSSCAPSGGERECSPLPLDVAGIDTGVSLSAGNAHTCAVLSDGTMRCWGSNNTGQLGDGTADTAAEPVAVAGISGAIAVAGGRFHTCALLSDGAARCWGLDNVTQLGTASIPRSGTAPVDVVGLSSPTAIAGSTCARLMDGTVRCWGLGLFGELGTSRWKASPVPVMVEGITDAVGIDRTCALLRDGTVRCWPPNPAADQSVTNAVAVARGGGHRCALIADGTVLCWGFNSSGQLGNGEQSFCTERQLGENVEVPCSPVPVRVVGITTARAIAAGGRHACALLADETVRCWGSGRLTPVTVDGIAGAAEITAGGGTTCAVLRDGTIRCWGESFSAPTAIEGITTATAVSIGGGHSCAVLADGSVRCWGRNSDGQLGDGTRNDSAHPVLVRGVSGATAVAVGGSFTCALLSDGRVRCWGNNHSGALGNGVPGGFSAVPVEVVRMVPQASGSTTLTVLRPNRPPVADAGPDQVAECTSPAGALVALDGGRSSDPDGDALSFEWMGSFGSVGGPSASVTLPLGTSEVALTVTDGRATDVDTVMISIRDSTAPAITPPPPVVVEATGPSGQPVAIGTATAVDACDPAPRVASDAPAVFPLGTTAVTWTATDASGNSAAAAQAVTVRDTTPPVLTVPGRIVMDAVGPDGAPVTYSALATDVADLQPIVTCVPPSGSTFAIGTTTVACMATDATGNASAARFEVHVKGADEQLADLMSLVTSVAPGDGIATGLNAKLQQVREALAAGPGRPTTCNVLGAFVHEVQGLSPNALAVDVADQLSATARRIQAVLTCL